MNFGINHSVNRKPIQKTGYNTKNQEEEKKQKKYIETKEDLLSILRIFKNGDNEFKNYVAYRLTIDCYKYPKILHDGGFIQEINKTSQIEEFITKIIDKEPGLENNGDYISGIDLLYFLLGWKNGYKGTVLEIIERRRTNNI